MALSTTDWQVGDPSIAHRLPDQIDGDLPDYDEAAIVYWKTPTTWYINLPGAGLGNLAKHQVVEHTGGAITVTPSILVEGGHGSRHGFIEQGVWRDA